MRGKRVAQLAAAGLPFAVAADLKTARVQILMSAAELRAIDDWRFANRIGSRGEAMRLLARAGIEAHAQMVAPGSVDSGSAAPRKRRARKG